MIDEIAAEYNGKVTVGKVNIDDHQSLAIEYGVNAIPTLLVFKGGSRSVRSSASDRRATSRSGSRKSSSASANSLEQQKGRALGLSPFSCPCLGDLIQLAS